MTDFRFNWFRHIMKFNFTILYFKMINFFTR